jgi:hypothetical protein
MMRILLAAVVCGGLAGCAASASESTSQQADDAACTAQGDAVYNANTVDEQARTAQNGLIYGATPTHVFDAEQLGAEHVRDSQIANCEENGMASGPEINGMPVVTPHIVGSP